MKSWKQATEPKMDFAKVRCWAGLFSNLIYFSFKQSASEQHTATDLNGWFYFIFWPVLSDNNRLLQAVTGKQDYCLEKAYFRILVLCLTHCISTVISYTPIQLWKTVIQQKQVYDMQGFASRQTQDRYQRHEADKTNFTHFICYPPPLSAPGSPRTVHCTDHTISRVKTCNA